MKLFDLIKDYPHEIIVDGEDREISTVEYDSRVHMDGGLFFCLPGAKFDGHEFADAAYFHGARAFIVEQAIDVPEDAVQIKVDNARLALAYISARFYGDPAKELKIIGITGTKGKTTTSILIEEILSACEIKCGYIGSNGVVIGEKHYETINSTPESRELHKYFRIMRNMGYTHVVMEVSSQALDHCRVMGIPFDTVVFTNLGKDHIGDGEHASYEEYRDAKRKLFTDYSAAHVIYNEDDRYSDYMVRGSSGERISFGIDSEADYTATSILPYRDATSLGIDFDVVKKGVRTPIRLRTPGHFSVYNALSALAVCEIYGVSLKDASRALAHISVTGRFQVVDAIPGVTFIIDYAHNGMSLRSALSVLREYEPRRLICLFGCIGGRTLGRRQELAEAAGELADYTIISSDNPDHEEPELIIEDVLRYFDQSKPFVTIPDREEAVRYAVRMAREGDIVLLAGKGHENYQLIRGRKVPFSERAIILDETARIIEAI